MVILEFIVQPYVEWKKNLQFGKLWLSLGNLKVKFGTLRKKFISSPVPQSRSDVADNV